MTDFSACIPGFFLNLVAGIPLVDYTGSAQLSCTNGQLAWKVYPGSNNPLSPNLCSSGSPKSISIGTSGCAASGSSSIKVAGCGSSSNNVCFHETTLISLGDANNLSLAALRDHDECVVPHIVEDFGVTITSRCGVDQKVLKVTDSHLLFTQHGLKAAINLQPGVDTLFSDLTETSTCHVLRIEKEEKQQKYFGLNCLSSQVLANGVKASTFGKLHSIPALWMQVVGRIFGAERASRTGDFIAELAYKLNII